MNDARVSIFVYAAPMTTSHLDSPRLIADLGVGITAHASLATGVAAFLTARPTRIVLGHASGSLDEPIDLPRINALDLALPSKDYAFVRDREGTVWSVPLTDPLRVREVARDIQALCARPAGESALAISEHGKLYNLSLSRGEVGVRPIDVPGRTRAVDVSEGSTHLLAEGDGGGQLRIYAGTAIDRGPIARVTLPEEAAGFENVRSGGTSCVTYKRGESALCLVTREGSHAHARMVDIEAPIADVAVTPSSIVVAFADGRLALYDAATVASTDERRAIPTNVKALGCKGRPRFVFALTTKGSTSIWVGTTTGEVVVSSLVERDVKPEVSQDQPHASLSTPAVDSNREELDAARAALEAKSRELQLRTDERDRVALEVANAVAREAAQEARLRDVEAAHAARMGTIEAAHEARMAQRDDAHRAQLREVEAAHEALLAVRDARVSECEAKLATEIAAHADCRTALERAHADLEQMKTSLERVKADLLRERKEYAESRAKRIENALPERALNALDVVASILGSSRRDS